MNSISQNQIRSARTTGLTPDTSAPSAASRGGKTDAKVGADCEHGHSVSDGFQAAQLAGTSLADRIKAFDGKYTRTVPLADVKAGKTILKLGDQGEAVSFVQKQLGIAADGKYGPQTARAVAAFQKSNQLKPAPQDEGSVGKTTLAKLSGAAVGGSGPIRFGKGWGGSEGVADNAKAIARGLGIPVTSEKRNLAQTQNVGSSTASDHYTGNTEAFATDFGVSGAKGTELANKIADTYGIPRSNIGTFNGHTISVGDRKYRLQLLWKVAGHFDHVHLGIKRVA